MTSPKRPGRPRKIRIRSRMTAGIASAPDCPEDVATAIVEAADEYDPPGLVARVWHAYTSFLAHRNASTYLVGVADELRDLADIKADAAEVRRMLQTHADLQEDPRPCITVACRLAERLAHFPNQLWTQTTTWAGPDALAFESARTRLHSTIGRVRLWQDHRERHLDDLAVILSACDRLEADPPPRFTKRRQDARNWFERDLIAIYNELIHPERVALWSTTHDDANDPPPAPRHREFARECMDALGVPFETKTRRQ